MKQLQALHTQLSSLAEKQDWQTLAGLDRQVQATVQQAMQTITDAEKPQAMVELAAIQKLYQDAVALLQCEQGESASEIQSIQRSMRAARSYLDLSK